MRQALFLIEEGATPRQVDDVMRSFGMAMGPFAMSDLAGNDIGHSVRVDQGWTAESIAASGQRYWAALPDALVAMGRLGQKSKKGWYDYSEGRTPKDEPLVEEMIVARSAEIGLTRREVGAAEILDRLLLPMVNEGFKIVEEGIAQRESDLNIVYLYGYGFPRKSGGPMHWARHVRPGGLAQLVADLHAYAAKHPGVGHWEPCKLLVEAAEAERAKAAKL